VECFGPTDMTALWDYYTAGDRTKPFLSSLLGADLDTAEKTAREMSPIRCVKDGESYPPFLLLHGNGDPVVPYETQAVPMAERLDASGSDVSLVLIEGAEHEGNFWSDELHDIILAFIDKHMK